MPTITDEQLTFFYKLSIEFIHNELVDMGILLTHNSVLYLDAEQCETMLLLRELFDREFLNTFYASDDCYNFTKAFIESYEGDEDLALTNFLEKVIQLKPLSLNWGKLYMQRFEVLNNSSFVNHLSATVENFDKTDFDIVSTAQFANFLSIRTTDVLEKQQAIATIFNHTISTDEE